MSSKDLGTIEEARRVLHESRTGCKDPACPNWALPEDNDDQRGATALDRAELLVTPEMRELCQAASAVIDETFYSESKWSANNNKRFAAAVSAYRALKQPKPRWTVEQARRDWVVAREESVGLKVCVAWFAAEPDARAYAASKNAEGGAA